MVKATEASQFKTPAGVEFCELQAVSGLSPAEISRRMEISEASVSKYLNGKVSPPPSRVSALRKIVAEIKGQTKYASADTENVSGMDHPEVRSDAAKLEDIRRGDPKKYQSLREVIGTYHSTVSSAAERTAAENAPAALRLALRPGPGSPPAHKAGAPISYKRKPKRGTGARSAKPPESPNPAPK